jgi:hypothetical protein
MESQLQSEKPVSDEQDSTELPIKVNDLQRTVAQVEPLL